MTGVWWLYLSALLVEIAGLTIGAVDLSDRIRKLKSFVRPPRPVLPGLFNEMSEVSKLLATQGLDKSIQDQREVNNELIHAIGEQVRYSDAIDIELGKLVGLGDKLGRLVLAAVLLFVGAVLGGAANLIGSYEG